MTCYYKEVFVSGFLVAFIVFAIFTLFGNVIHEWVRNFIKFLGVN